MHTNELSLPPGPVRNIMRIMSPEAAVHDAEAVSSPAVLQVLVDHHRQFLAFLERRVGSRQLAEDILQDAFVRGIDKLGDLRSEESAIAWFYRALRNSVVDHHRRSGAHDRKLAALERELDSRPGSEVELDGVICGCVSALASTLKREYRVALRSVDVEGLAVKEFAARTGISASNAAVRLFRARAALRQQVMRACGTCAEHGCVDCTCAIGPAACGVPDASVM